MTFLILCIKLPAPNEHRGSHLCTVGAHTLSMYADAGAVTKREATSFSYPTCNYGSILLTREPGQRCSRAQGLGISGLPPHPRRAGGRCPLVSSFELLLASQGQQLPHTPQVGGVVLVVGKQEALEEGLFWQVVSLVLSTRQKVFSLATVLVHVAWSAPAVCVFVINVCKLESLNVCP